MFVVISIGFLGKNNWLNSNLRLDIAHTGHRACTILTLFFFLLSFVAFQEIVLTDGRCVETFVQAFLLSIFKEVFHCFSYFFILLIRCRDKLKWKVIVGVFGYVA